jgi:hypothetical protein
MDKRRVTEQRMAIVRKFRPMIPVFLSTKAAQLGTQNLSVSLCIAAVMEEQALWDSFTVVSLPARADERQYEFEEVYRARMGSQPGIGAFEIYEAVRLAAEGLRAAGANRETILRGMAGFAGQRLSFRSIRLATAWKNSRLFRWQRRPERSCIDPHTSRSESSRSLQLTVLADNGVGGAVVLKVWIRFALKFRDDALRQRFS